MFTFYTVGGSVRDSFLGLESKDIDYVAVPDIKFFEKEFCNPSICSIFDWLIEYLKGEGYHIFLTTPEMYTIRAKFPKGHINEGVVADFVLARKEIGYKEGTREPIVVPGTLLDDLSRRDFTCNAIARDLDGNIYDPFNGREAIEKKLLSTPIKGEITFEDDPLRLLRALRFVITKGFSVDDNIRNLLVNFDYDKKFKVISEERIYEELKKCFLKDTYRTIFLLTEIYKDLGYYVFTKTNLKLTPILVKP